MRSGRRPKEPPSPEGHHRLPTSSFRRHATLLIQRSKLRAPKSLTWCHRHAESPHPSHPANRPGGTTLDKGGTLALRWVARHDR
jgi:hypothetical protein